MNRKFLLCLSTLALCLLLSIPAEAARKNFHWFSIWVPEQDWTVLWSSLDKDMETVIVRKNDYSALLVVSVGGSDGLELRPYAESMRKAFNGTPVQDNGSGGYTFTFAHNQLGRSHYVYLWGRKDDVKTYVFYGVDPVMRDIMASFRYLEE